MGGFLADLDKTVQPTPAAAASAAPQSSFLGGLDASTGGIPATDTRQPSGLSVGMDPAKFNAVAAGIADALGRGRPSSTILQGADAGGGLYQTKEGLSITPDPDTIKTYKGAKAQEDADVAAHPAYHTAGKVGAVTLLGAAGGAEAPAEGGIANLVKSMSKAGGMADLSLGGSEAGHAIAPDSKIAPLAGGLLFPAGMAGLAATMGAAGRGLAGALVKPTDDTASLMQLSETHGIPMAVPELAGQNGVGLGGVARVLEKTPFSGMVKFRAGQQAALQQRAPDIAAGYAANVPEAALNDPQAALQSYIGQAEQGVRSQATAKYNNFLAKAVQADGKVPLTNLKAAAQKVIDENSQLPASMRSAAYPTAQDVVAMPDEVNISTASALDKSLGAAASSAAKQFNTGNTTKVALRHYTMMDQALGGDKGDLQAFAQTQPDDVVGAYNDAKQFYKDNVSPFNDPDVRRLGSDRFDTDTLLTRMVKNNRPQLAQKLMGVLPPEGQATLKYSVLDRLMTNANYGSEVKPFSPKQFANSWNKLGATKDALFTPEEQTELDGYSKLVTAAPEPMSNPRTGAENTGLLGIVALKELAGTVGYKAMAPLIFGTRSLTSMMTQPWGKRLLLTASQTNDPGLLRRLAVGTGLNLQRTASNAGSVGVAAQKTQQLPVPGIAAAANQ